MTLGGIMLVVVTFLVLPGDGEIRGTGVPRLLAASLGLLAWGVMSIHDLHPKPSSRLV